MIKEYAVEPAAFAESFLRLHSHFGVNHGRVISDFPQNWIAAVLHACPKGYRRSNNLITVLKLLDGGKVFVDGNRTYVKVKSWLENALEQHALKPFHTIIAQNNPQCCAEVMIPQGIFENSELFKTETTTIIKRKAEVIAMCAFSLIQYSQEVILVDPHFCKIRKIFR